MRFRHVGTVIALSAGLLAGCDRAADGTVQGGESVSGNDAAAPDSTSRNVAAPSSPARLALLPRGLETIDARGRRTLHSFGTQAKSAMPSLTGLFGAPTKDGMNSDCGSGPTRIVRWSNGLRILARDERLQGWEVDAPGIYALGDLQVGMTRAALEANRAAFEQTTLGTKWTVGEGDQSVSGLLGEDGHVSAMWSGLTCHMT